MPENEARPRILPPHVAGLLLLGATAVHFAVPRSPAWREPRAGVALLLLGLAVLGWAARLFGRAGTPIKPYQTPRRLVDSGPYRFTRNPMYVALATALLGVALLVGSPPFFAVPLVFLAVVRARFVPMEERNLEAALGEDYRRYRQRTRRWL